MTFATHWVCLACGARWLEASGFPCGKCHNGPLIRLVVKDPK